MAERQCTEVAAARFTVVEMRRLEAVVSLEGVLRSHFIRRAVIDAVNRRLVEASRETAEAR